MTYETEFWYDRYDAEDGEFLLNESPYVGLEPDGQYWLYTPDYGPGPALPVSLGPSVPVLQGPRSREDLLEAGPYVAYHGYGEFDFPPFTL